MNKRHLALAAGLVLVLIGLAIVLITTRPAPAFTVRCSRVAPFEDGVGVNVEFTNHTPRTFSVMPLRLERMDGGNWKKWEDGVASFSWHGDLTAHSSAKLFCLVKRLPPGTHLRLVMQRTTARRGLDSFLVRAELRLSGQNNVVSLTPFDRKTIFFTDPTEITVDFVSP